MKRREARAWIYFAMGALCFVAEEATRYVPMDRSPEFFLILGVGCLIMARLECYNLVVV